MSTAATATNPQVVNFSTIARGYATAQLQICPNIPDQHRVFAGRRFEYNFKVDCFNASTVAAIALITLGLLASKIILIVGLISLLARHSVQKHLIPNGEYNPIFNHYLDANNPERTTDLKRHMGIANDTAWHPDANSAFDVIVWKNKAPMEGYVDGPQGGEDQVSAQGSVL